MYYCIALPTVLANRLLPAKESMLMVLAGWGQTVERGWGVLSATEKLTQNFVVGNILGMVNAAR